MVREGQLKQVIREPEFGRNKIPAKKFALYVSFASVIMLFSGLTSAYIVRQAAGNWLEFPLPNLFYTSTILIVLSSISLQVSYISFKRGKKLAYQWLLAITFILGIAFTIMQYQAWLEMNAMGVYLNGNPSGAFIFVISGIHAAHVIGGIGALLVAIVHAFVLPYYLSAKRKLRFELVLIYWHFVGFLWIYLLVFFILQQS